MLNLLDETPVLPMDLNESESTIDLQQYAAQLRDEISRPPSLSASSARESLTTDLQSVAKEVLNYAVLDQNDVAQRTDALLQRMSSQPSSAAVAAMDDTITEDLRRLSQLLVAQPEEKPRFSPLVARSGTKQVIHSVKSSQKYAPSATEEVRVINSMPARPLFQEEEKEEEKEEEEKESLAKKEQPSALETSINLDAYFLPKSFRSILEDSTPQAESIDYDTTEKSTQSGPNRMPSIESLPSDIQENSIQMEESSLGDWDEKANDSVEKVEDSLEGVLENKQTQKTESKPQSPQINETPINETPISETPSIDKQRKLNLLSQLASINFFREKASTQFARRCQQILDSKNEVQQLCSLYKQIREAKQQQNELDLSWKRAEQSWKEAEQSFAREIQKEKLAMEDDSTLREKEKEEANLKRELEVIGEDLGLQFALQSDQSYAILLRKDRQLVAAITVRFVGRGKVSLKVTPQTSCSKLVRKRIEARLPMKQEKVVNCSDMREWICRCIWIAYHSF